MLTQNELKGKTQRCMNGKCRYNTYNANGRLAETYLEM
jgi:hypothetical protein